MPAGAFSGACLAVFLARGCLAPHGKGVERNKFSVAFRERKTSAFSGGAWRCFLREAAWLPHGISVQRTGLSNALLSEARYFGSLLYKYAQSSCTGLDPERHTACFAPDQMAADPVSPFLLTA